MTIESEAAITVAKELLDDEYAPELSNGERSWLEQNIARLLLFYSAGRLSEALNDLSDDQVIAYSVREYRGAERAVEAAHKTKITVLEAIINSYRRQLGEPEYESPSRMLLDSSIKR